MGHDGVVVVVVAGGRSHWHGCCWVGDESTHVHDGKSGCKDHWAFQRGWMQLRKAAENWLRDV